MKDGFPQQRQGPHSSHIQLNKFRRLSKRHLSLKDCFPQQRREQHSSNILIQMIYPSLYKQSWQRRS
ncbi:hypothetical protein R3I94_007855 [Phoxinus phoxinus]